MAAFRSRHGFEALDKFFDLGISQFLRSHSLFPYDIASETRFYYEALPQEVDKTGF